MRALVTRLNNSPVRCPLVPAPGEQHPLLALLKVAGTTLALLGIGVVVYLFGSRAARRAAA